MRLWRALAALTLLTTASFSTDANACAACRNPALPVTRGNEGELSERTLRVSAALSATTLHVVHEAGCSDLGNCDEIPIQPLYLHDQRIYPVELRVSTEYGFTKLFGVEFQLPVRVVTTSIEYTTPDGDPYEPLDPGIHHRDETLIGLVDPWLLARFSTRTNGYFLAARPGVSLPLGHTEEDPYALGDQGLEHQHIQFGTGTFDPLLVLEASRHFKPVDLAFFSQGQASLYENSHGFRAPWRAMAALSVGTFLVKKKFSASLGPEIVHESAEKWDGKIRQDGNLGRTEISIAPAATWILNKTSLALTAHIPIWRHIVEGDEPQGTLQSPLALTLSVTQLAGPLGTKHAH